MRFLLVVATTLALSTSVQASPSIHVRVASVTDAVEQAAHVALIKRALRDLQVDTMDVSVSKLAIHRHGDRIDVRATIEIVVSRGAQIRSMASGSAQFSIPYREYRADAPLRREAIKHALEAVRRRLRPVA